MMSNVLVCRAIERSKSSRGDYIVKVSIAHICDVKRRRTDPAEGKKFSAGLRSLDPSWTLPGPFRDAEGTEKASIEGDESTACFRQ